MSIEVSALQGPLTELMSQLAGRNGDKRFEEFKLWLKRVGAGYLVDVNRSLTAEQAVDVAGRVWGYKKQTELESAPVSGSDRVMLKFFELDYEPTPTELEAEYRSRVLTPDLAALSAYMKEKPESADDRPIACQWGLNPDGNAACAIFDRFDGGRSVVVDRSSHQWDRRYRFAGVHK